jgi:hypothetical protein
VRGDEKVGVRWGCMETSPHRLADARGSDSYDIERAGGGVALPDLV